MQCDKQASYEGQHPQNLLGSKLGGATLASFSHHTLVFLCSLVFVGELAQFLSDLSGIDWV